MQLRFLWCLLAACLACGGDFPRDPERTSDRVSQSRLVRVGFTEHAPWVTRHGAAAQGPEAALIERFAHSLGAKVAWRAGQQEALLTALERFELDVVIGGLGKDTMFAKRIGVSRPWHIVHDERQLIIAVPPGENAWLGKLERFLMRNESALLQLAQEASQ